VIPRILERAWIDASRRTDEVQQKVTVIASRSSRQLGDELCTAKACGTFDTERNQPMRVCATAAGFSMRIFER
jgi:hypothetical protein